MFNVITFGSATQDIYLKSKKFSPRARKIFQRGMKICFNLGSKIKVDEIIFFSGGGGTNTAATFKKQGLKVAYCGMVGDDYFGNRVVEEIKKLNIDTQFIKKTKIKPTNISVFLVYPKKDRVILVYRGASDILSKKDIPWKKIKNTRWFYLSPFSGKIAALTEEIIDFAKKNKIKIALNPGYEQLTLPQKTLERILKKVDVLILNREEASLLTKIPYQKEREVFKKLDELVKGIAIMTKGKEGAVVSDGEYLYTAPALKVKVIDLTGAGDAFGSGFVSGLTQKNDISFSIQLAIANSNHVITKWGAKEGLLRNGQKWKKVKLVKEKL